MSGIRIGIDLGGTKIESIALGPKGEELARLRTDAPRHDYKETLEALHDHVIEMNKQSGAKGSVGLGIPGAIDPNSGVVKNANSTWINGEALDKDLARVLDLPVRIANDANCFALSEASDGAASGANVVIGVIVGTGCGSGLVVGGRVLTGPNAIAGEWGHNALPRPRDDELPGPECFCGQRGCLETWISGTGLERCFQVATGQSKSAREVCVLAESGDPEAELALSDYEDRFARAISVSINILDPDIIVLGGGMSNVERLYTNIPPLLPRYAMSPILTTRFVKNKHGDSSGVRGAAWLWPSEQTP